MTKREVLQRHIAASLDHPSVYMGGPSKQNMRKAERLIEWMERDGYLVADKITGEYVHERGR